MAQRQDDEFASGTMHSVYQSFLPFFAKTPASDRQLVRLADLINAAVSAGGDAENAVSTCMLEHLNKVGQRKTLQPFLSREAKSRLRP